MSDTRDITLRFGKKSMWTIAIFTAVIMARIQLSMDLTKEQTGEIAAFLKSLTGTIPEAALKAPVLPSAD